MKRRLSRFLALLWRGLSFVCVLFLLSSSLAMKDNVPIRIWSVYFPPTNCSVPASPGWIAKVNHIRWVAYSSPNPDPDGGFYQPTPETIQRDLLILKKAKFTGLVTYGSLGVMGKDFPVIAQSLGFDGVIMGVWDPNNHTELENAIEASRLPIVLGYSVGNEGLYRSRDRYTPSDLCSAIADLRAGTGKPVTTSEEIDDYYNHPELLSVGDWIFPNAHPYWHSTKYPNEAVKWEEEQYQALTERTDRFVLFKEVGLPTEGAYGLSEANHGLYYRALAETDVRFVYFEGFDQPSKLTSSVEPHWGIFRSNRMPKNLAWDLMGYRIFDSSGFYDGEVSECSAKSNKGCYADSTGDILNVGQDAEGRQYRGILSFNTEGLPDTAIILAVRLRVKSAGMVGANPFAGRNSLMLDICSSFIGASAGLQAADFQASRNCNNGVAKFDKTPVNGWYSADLDSDFLQNINPRGITQFRLWFLLKDGGDARRNSIKIYSEDAEDSNEPVLIVRYQLP